jgi:hypothetical protein
MNHDQKPILFSLCLSLWLGVTGFSFALPIRVTTDISSLSGSDFELEFALDGAGAVAASVLLDNIIIKDSGGTTIVLTLSPSDTAFFKYETGVGSSFDAGITNIQAIPEPSTLALFAVGVLSILGVGYHRRKRAASSHRTERPRY